jgi:hypothetical protein
MYMGGVQVYVLYGSVLLLKQLCKLLE